MSLKPLSFADIMAVVDTWSCMGGSPEVEIGALEPLLWKDGKLRINDVVIALTERGCKVSMTTNGQLLDTFAHSLSNAGLSLIRTSWHSTDPLMFREISGGYGDYSRFMRGVTLALESGIKVSFNRVLHKGYTDDIPEQLSFIERYRSRLKLYTLLWTPQSASTYESFYQDWRSVVRASVLPRTAAIVRERKRLGRGRLRFRLVGGGSVEVKLGDKLDRGEQPCASCLFKNECEEGFGDYVRVDPRLHLYFCYMRRDLGFQLSEYFGRPEALKQKLSESFGTADLGLLLKTTPLRLTVTPFCNFNCRAPGAQQGWCMEEPGEFVYPKILTSLLKRE
ncbi:MAG: Molybdenum cofactor biosynthesis protein [Parcubacteria group bacterium GW2011_GWA2_51_12]|nr:MAG: Molybdenum cofactor biosynthesis protein [Parcubacteria group bacterium GW2011_GWA2_51_12]